MAADILPFQVFARSSKGLIARIILPTNVAAVKNDIDSISYEAIDKTGSDPVLTGSIDPDEVMFGSLQPWSKDPLGFNFLWAADGNLWPDPDKRYNIKITFTIVTPFTAKPSLAGKSFILVYEANTKSPDG